MIIRPHLSIPGIKRQKPWPRWCESREVESSHVSPLLKVATWQQTFMNGQAMRERQARQNLAACPLKLHRSSLGKSFVPAVERVNRKPDQQQSIRTAVMSSAIRILKDIQAPFPSRAEIIPQRDHDGLVVRSMELQFQVTAVLNLLTKLPELIYRRLDYAATQV